MNRRTAGTHLLLAALLMTAAAAGKAHAQSRSQYIPRTERGRLAAQIVQRWALEGAKRLQTTPLGWAGAMRSTLARQPLEHLRRATGATTYEQMSADIQGGSLDAMATQKLVFTSMPPCRIVHTRDVQNPILAGETRTFSANPNGDTPAQGWSSTCLGVPQTAVAAALHITAIGPEGNGHLTVFPEGTVPYASSLNYQKGINIANELPVLLLASESARTFNVFSNFNTNVAVDVVGYYEPMPTFVLQGCTERGPTSLAVTDGLTTVAKLSPPACGETETRMSFHCESGGTRTTLLGRSNLYCKFIDAKADGLSGTGYAYSTCCTAKVFYQ